jgi:hypothetical protein
MAPDLPALESAISNDCWMVRHYAPARTPTMRLQRQQAILKLGLTVREAFARSDDFERLLVALVDGLRPRESSPPF